MSRPDREVIPYIVGFGGVAVVGMFFMLAIVTSKIGPAAIPIWFAALGSSAWILRGPLGKALASRISGEAAAADMLPEVPEAVYAELDDLRVRVGELEERIDFSERLLAQRSQQGEGS
jgi:hypothetical protein